LFILQISGDANEEQLLNAAASCMKKPAVMEYILKDIFSFMLIFNLNEKDKLLNITLDVLTINVYFKPIQVFGKLVLINNSLQIINFLLL